MKLIVGLGNPGLLYKKTRHNVGFMFVDQLIKDFKLKFSYHKNLKCEIVQFLMGNEKIIVIKPQTYMNLSGESVLLVSNFYKIDLEDILVIYDDLDLPVGKIRIRKSGSSGGHKGMANIIQVFDSNQINRIRIGIDYNNNIETVDYVLGKFSKLEQEKINDTIYQAKEIINSYLTQSFDDFMQRYN